jgi:hypothetical protein
MGANKGRRSEVSGSFGVRKSKIKKAEGGRAERASKKEEGRSKNTIADSGQRIAESSGGPLVNLTSMTDVMQIDPTLLYVEFVKHAVIAYSQLEFRSALKSLVGEICQPRAHVANVTLRR